MGEASREARLSVGNLENYLRYVLTPFQLKGQRMVNSNMRIVSLLPSATEIVYSLGAQDRLFGVTYACDFPPSAMGKPIVVRSRIQAASTSSGEIDGAVKESISANEPIFSIDMDAMAEAQPDLILTQGLCEVCAVPSTQVDEAVERLAVKPQILSLDPHSLSDLLNDIVKVGEAIGEGTKAKELVGSLELRRDRVASTAAAAETKPTVACLEWLDPLMTAGHWVPEMVNLAGGKDCFGTKGQPSFKIDWSQILEAQPAVIVAMPCGFDVRRGISEIPLLTDHEGWNSLPAAMSDSLFVVDGGAYFSRSGPRLLDGLELMAEILHPELFRGLVPQDAAVRIYGQPFKVS